MLMGARVYNPSTGQFTSTDPEFGGGQTAYGYPTDPVNAFDLNGKWWSSWWHRTSSSIRYVAYQGLRGLAFPVYGVYYAAYRFNRSRFSYACGRCRVLAWGAQAGGLAGDAAIDWAKRRTGYAGHENVWDEGGHGYLNPFHKSQGHGTHYLPGLRRDKQGHHHIDFAW